MTTGTKLRAFVLSVLMVFSVFAGSVAFAGTGLGAGTAGNVSLSINAAGNQATVTVDDSDLNTNSGSKQSHIVNIFSDSEAPTTSSSTGSDTGDGNTQRIPVASTGSVEDRNNDNSITTADFGFSGASDESISSTSKSNGKRYVTIADSGGKETDGTIETVTHTRAVVGSTSGDTGDGSTTTVTTSSPVGDRNGDGVLDPDDIGLAASAASDESITSVSPNTDGTVDITIADSGGNKGDSSREFFDYIQAERIILTETSGDTGTFIGSISIDQSNSKGTLYAQDGDQVEAVYFDNGGSPRRTASQTLSLGDTTAPTISNYKVSNPSGKTIKVVFESTEQLNTIDVGISGAGSATLTESAFSGKQQKGGTYVYTATYSAQNTGDFTVTLNTAKDAAGNDGASGQSSKITLSGSTSNTFINGTVTNKSGSAIDGAMAVAIPESGQKEITDKTDANGNYSLGVSAGNSYEVIVDDHPDHPFKVKSDISVSQSKTKTVDFKLKAFPGEGFLNGTVLDSSGNPVGSGVSVSARDMGYRFSGTTKTNANGNFSMKLSAADYIVRAKGPNSPPQSLENITVKEGQTTQVTLQLPQTGYISGTVEDASGNAKQGVGVVADSGDQIVFDKTNKKGEYNITAPAGNFTVTVFAKGQNAASKQVTVTNGNTVKSNFTLKKTTVTHSSVEVVSGSGVQTSSLGVRSALETGMLRVKLVNETKSGKPLAVGAPHELENLGVTDNTKFRMNITVTNFTASSLMWGVDDARWSTSQNASNPNATDITVTGTPVQLQVNFGGKGGGVETGIGPLMFKDPSQVSWPSGRNDRATAGRNQTVYFSIFDLSNMPGAVQNRMSGMSVTTNAQRFSTPSVQNNSLRVWVAAPTKTVAGTDHNGFYQAEIPDSQLSEWGVDDPESELEALYKGDPANFTVTDTSSGARIRLDNISYSAGYAEVQAKPNSGGGGGGGGGGGSTPTGTTATVEETGGSTSDQANGPTTVNIERVSEDDPTVTVSVDESTDEGLSVSEVSATFDTGTSTDNEMTVDASGSPPATVPEPAEEDEDGDEKVLGYVSVDVEGSLDDHVASGSFLVHLENTAPGDVIAKHYHDGEWQTVETRRIDASTVKIITPDYSTFAITTEPRDTTTPTATPTPTLTPTPTPTTTPAQSTQTPAPTETLTPTPEQSGETPVGTDATESTTATATATQTPGAAGPGFGVLVALLALVVTLARLRRTR